MTSADSLKLLQYCYQMTALDNELYQLQNALIKSYFAACDHKCETGKCSDGAIASAAMAYFLDGRADSALALCDMIRSSGNSEPAEIARIIRNVYEGKQMQADRVKTASGIAFLTVVSDSSYKADYIAVKLKKNKSLDLQYALAYALAESPAEIGKAWSALPDYPPYSRSFPEPSFIDEIKTSDTVFTERIYLPLGLYIRKEVDNLLLTSLFLQTKNEEHAADINALKAFAYLRGIGGIKGDFCSSATPEDNSDPRSELVYSLKMAQADSSGPSGRLEALKHPVSRAAYLEYLIDHGSDKNRDRLNALLMAEVDSSRARMIWESRVLLSSALARQLGPVEAFRQMGNFGVSDLTVHNNSPEWLAIYAQAGLYDGSQLGLVSQVIFNLSQHYPYLIGLYEIAQSYNHICKYF